MFVPSITRQNDTHRRTCRVSGHNSALVIFQWISQTLWILPGSHSFICFTIARFNCQDVHTEAASTKNVCVVPLKKKKICKKPFTGNIQLGSFSAFGSFSNMPVVECTQGALSSRRYFLSLAICYVKPQMHTCMKVIHRSIIWKQLS